MRRSVFGLLAMALMGFLASDASACCHKKKACAAPACAPAPVCAPAPTCAPKKKHCLGGGGGLFKGLCHKKAAPACAPACAPAPCSPCGEVAYTHAAPQSWPAAQAAPQGWAAPQVPTK